jgi:UDP-N-acetylmuramate dehydrogenase
MRFEDSLMENISLAQMTTLGLGGRARFFAEVTSAEALGEAIEWAGASGAAILVLGGGSNLVIADAGWPGLVLRISIRSVETDTKADQVFLRVGAGEEWDSLVELTVDRGWAGFECLSGIPGRVGATPVQNVGAYGQETSETLVSVEAFDLSTRRLVKLTAAECEFGYRTSRFKHRDRDRFIITEVSYRLAAGGDPAVRYAELKRHLDEQGKGSPTLSEVRESVIRLRKRKAMVIDPADTDSRSVGSFFVNPVVSLEQFEMVKQRASDFLKDGQAIPAFPAPDGQVKLSAAWLIERAGINRGYVHGNVGTSTKHALAIINRGGGTSREVAELAEIIKARVSEAFNVALTPEPIFAGFDDL